MASYNRAADHYMEASDILHTGLASSIGDCNESVNYNALTLARTVVNAPPVGLRHSISLLRARAGVTHKMSSTHNV